MKTLLAGISLLTLITLSSSVYCQSAESQMPNPKNTELKATRAASNAVIKPNSGVIVSVTDNQESAPTTEKKTEQVGEATPVKTRTEAVSAPTSTPKK